MKLKLKKLFTIIMSIIMLISSTLLPSMQSFAEGNIRVPDISVTDFDMSKLDLYEFKCRQENMQVIHQGISALQEHVVPNGTWKRSTVFMHKYNKYAVQQSFDNVLELLFRDAGEINGKKVNVRVKVTRLELNPTQYCGQQHNFNWDNSGVPFLTVDQNWGDSGIQLMDYVYPEHPNFNSNTEQAFNTRSEVTATLEYADGTPCDLKLTMQPTDIDVKPGNPIDNGNMTSFYEGVGVKDVHNSIDKIVYNINADLRQHDYPGNWHWWEPQAYIGEGGTSGTDEFNKSGFAMRSRNNSITFAYNSSATSGSLFKFFAEVPYYHNPEKTAKKIVDRVSAPKIIGEPIKYTVTYTVPRPGIDIIDDIKTLKFTDQFDKKVDFKNAEVKLDGKVLKENTDYKLLKIEALGVPPTIEIDIINKSLFGRDKAGKTYEITYNTVTNKNALVKGDDKVINSTARMYFDGVPIFANSVETRLITSVPPKKDVFTPGDLKQSINGKVVSPGEKLTYK
ncbi:Sgo0707 family adhesin, partial [Peptostreptococcus canis]